MNMILSIAIAVTLLTSLILVVRFRNVKLRGSDPLPLTAFIAILFTSGSSCFR